MARRKRSSPWQPTTEDFLHVIQEQNPWHASGSVPEELARPVERQLARLLWRRLLEDAPPRRSQVVLGPRRVGKTTVMYQTVRHLLAEGLSPRRLWWLRLDHPLLVPIELGDLVRLVLGLSGATPETPALLFLDELAYARSWDLWLKTFHDERWPVRIVATSSSTAALRDRKLESGVGRWEELYLAPYLLTEFLELLRQDRELPLGATLADTLRECVPGSVDWSGLGRARETFLLTGGFPELLTSVAEDPEAAPSRLPRFQEILRGDAVERAVYKDIPQAFGIDNPPLLERLLYVLAAEATGLLSPRNICNDLGMSPPTFDKYLSYLERAFLAFVVPNYSGSERAVQRRGRKLYFVDGAIRNAALQRGSRPLEDPGEMGVLLENAVASHLHALSQQTSARLFHWRSGANEVDLVHDHTEGPLAFEITASSGHSRKGLRAFCEEYPRFRERCYVVSPHARLCQPQDSIDGIGSLPVDVLLLAVGWQAASALAGKFG